MISFIVAAVLLLFLGAAFLMQDDCGDMGWLNQSGNCEYE